jgi:2-(1,2-epoxy-1,2-dihydrophenyl)acetyl-CoA isomerase
MELCMTGRPVKATEALAIGLVNQVVPADELEAATTKMATRLSSLPAKALGLTKRLLNESFERTLPEQLEAEAFAQDTAGRTSDHFEGVTAFLQKRTPTFTGK